MISKEDFRRIHDKEGYRKCLYCGNQINGKTYRDGVSFIFKGGCPNEEHRLWKEMTEYLNRKDNAET